MFDINPVVYEVTGKLLAAMPEEVRVPIPNSPGGYFINPEAVEDLADVAQSVLAYMIAGIIDAGSERDAVMENESLREYIVDELKGWSHD